MEVYVLFKDEEHLIFWGLYSSLEKAQKAAYRWFDGKARIAVAYIDEGED